MAEPSRRLALELPWATLLKVLAAVALIAIWPRVAWIVLLVLLAIIVAVGLSPAVEWLERRRWPRWLAASTLVLALVVTIVGFIVLSWTSLADQAQNLGSRLGELREEVLNRLPPQVANLVAQSGGNGGSALAPYAMAVGRTVLMALAAFVLATVLVLFFLIESEQVYRWVRGFVPARLRERFDKTAADARDVAREFVIGNVVTSTSAGVYFFIWLSILGVPGALLLGVLGFLFDFIPVLGFYLSVIPAMAMAASESTTVMLALIPIYLSYDVIENYLLGPRVYGGRLRLSKIAVLLAFAVGGSLGGVVGAIVALPIAAIYPTIERLWLREPLGDEVVEEHRRLRSSA
ncbi:MAG: AI-2E family transporter [Vicinamibacterales bacterium]